jgi:hypothetical protein
MRIEYDRSSAHGAAKKAVCARQGGNLAMSKNSRFSAAVIAAFVVIASLHFVSFVSNGSTARSEAPVASQIDVTALTLAAGKLPAQQFDAI